jgi:8-oxo-dGTP pyrophosphatase MutT (NUDIX family)
MRGDTIRFLLVRTTGGRWTFPKGGMESGLSHAQTAALEAFEEAGVQGRTEEAAFACYYHRPRGWRGSESSASEFAVRAHLCEVLRLGRPQEPRRHPTWFSAKKAKQRLREDRPSEAGAELAEVVDRALFRLRGKATAKNRAN